MIKRKFYYPTEPLLYHLSVIANPNSTYGTTTGTGDYLPNSTVTITATPNTGYNFLQWKEEESSSQAITVTVDKNKEYNALFYKKSTGEIKIVDENLNMYSYDEYDTLLTKPNTIGVAINDGDSWLVYHKSYHKRDAYQSGENSAGIALGSSEQSPFPPSVVSDLLYPHSGKEYSDRYKTTYPSQSLSTRKYAAYEMSLLTDGGLDWYIPNLYELTQIFQRVEDTGGMHNGFNSHFILAEMDIVKITSPTDETISNRHAHWTCDSGYGASITAGKIIPYKIYYRGNNNMVYTSAGNYTFTYNTNFIRPVARIPIVNQ